MGKCAQKSTSIKNCKKTQKTFLNALFDELDSVQKSDPKKYMDLCAPSAAVAMTQLSKMTPQVFHPMNGVRILNNCLGKKPHQGEGL